MKAIWEWELEATSGTGHQYEHITGRYIGTAIDDYRGLVWHVFEVEP